MKAFVIPLGAGMNRHALKLARQLRAAGIAVDVSDESFRLKKSFETAEKLGATFAILVGENEVQADAFAVKNLKSGEQTHGGARGTAGIPERLSQRNSTERGWRVQEARSTVVRWRKRKFHGRDRSVIFSATFI